MLKRKKKRSLNYFKNPYGQGGASEKIINVLENVNYNNLLKKSFNNL